MGTEAVGEKMQARRGPPSVLLDSKKTEPECGRESKKQPVSGEGGEWWAIKLTAKKRQREVGRGGGAGGGQCTRHQAPMPSQKAKGPEACG